MVSGISKGQPLLTIAIPTWNRARTLETALLRILPQVKSWSDIVQLVVSDNASTDCTREVINNFVLEYPEIKINYFLQETNLGFYGNFCKVKELSNGKYIWILSDDDFVDEKLIDRIINLLLKHNDLGLMFLHDWTFKNKRAVREETKTIKEILYTHNYRLTLISSVIFINSKENDQYIATRLNKSNFIGFAFLVSEVKNQHKGIVLYGNSLSIGEELTKGFNWFQAFVIDINFVLAYMLEIGYSATIVNKIKHNIFVHVVLNGYRTLKAHSKLNDGLDTWDITKVNKLIFNYYGNDVYSILNFLPNYFLPSFVLRFCFFLKQNLRKYVWIKIKLIVGKYYK